MNLREKYTLQGVRMRRSTHETGKGQQEPAGYQYENEQKPNGLTDIADRQQDECRQVTTLCVSNSLTNSLTLILLFAANANVPTWCIPRYTAVAASG